jgi:virginiamycin A acetyltransferase
MIRHFIRKYLFKKKTNKRVLWNENGLKLDTYLSSRTSEISFEGYNSVGEFTRVNSPLKLGLASTIGAFCWTEGNVVIGNYTQIGPYVKIFGGDHNVNLLTPYNSKSLFSGRLKTLVNYETVFIGNSCWIGANSIILKGVSIGDGVVVGAGSVVTRSIPPYTICVGNPARVIKNRFDKDLIKSIERTKWWERPPGELSGFESLFKVDIVNHREEFENNLNQLFPDY